MILDGFLQFHGAATGDAITSTANSTNIIDLHMAGIPVLANNQGARDLGIGDDPALKLLVLTTAAFNNLTSLTVSLQGSPDNGSGAPAGFVTWYSSPAVLLASINTTASIGLRLLDMDVPRPPPGQPIPRFFQLAYTVAGSAASTGGVKGWIVLDRHDQVYNGAINNIIGGYPPGIIIAN